MYSFRYILILVFIWKFDIFPLMYAADNVWITELTLIHKNIWSVRNSHAQVYMSIWHKTHYEVTDKHNNVSSEGLDKYYHKYSSMFYRTRWDISNNVCLDLQNCHYSVLIFHSDCNNLSNLLIFKFKFKFIVLIFIHNFSSLMQFGDTVEPV